MLDYGDSPCLSSTSAFEIDELELWAVEDDPPLPSEEEQAAERGENALLLPASFKQASGDTQLPAVATGKGNHSDALYRRQESRPT